MVSNILIVGPAWVGDMVMAQCLFKLLKHNDPSVTLDVLAPAWSFPLLARMPEVSASIQMTLGHGQLDLRERYRLAQTLKQKKYVQAIVLPNSLKSALIPWLAGIPLRTGWRGEMRYVLLNDIRTLDKQKYPLMIEQFMALGLPKDALLPASYPWPALSISAELQQVALTKHGLTLDKTRPVLALCPGAEFGVSKRWPAAHYAAVANEKIKNGWDVWLFGSSKDQDAAAVISALTHHQCVDLTGKTKLDEAIDLLSVVSGVVSNDSGLMHIAAALDKPLIAVYGSTSPQFTPPISEKARVLQLSLDCQPCFQRVCPLKHHRCMNDLLPHQVLQAMDEWEI